VTTETDQIETLRQQAQLLRMARDRALKERDEARTQLFRMTVERDDLAWQLRSVNQR
jgi:hypothetical protein